MNLFFMETKENTMLLVAGYESGQVMIWDFHQNRAIASCKPHSEPGINFFISIFHRRKTNSIYITVTSLCVTPNHIYTGGADSCIYRTSITSLLESHDKNPERILQIEDVKGFGCLEYNWDRKLIIAGGWNGE
jgi:WD40 repeat protein